jgi:MFS family permease
MSLPAGPGEPPESPPPPRVRRAVRTIAVDTTPLKVSRDFRLLWVGELISETGYQISLAGVYLQVARMTGRADLVGLVGLCQLVPLVISSMIAGPLVDRKDRRMLLRFALVGYACASALLLMTALAESPSLGFIYLATAITGAFSGLANPARSAMVPTMVDREILPAAIALNQVMWSITAIVGPLAAGVIIAVFGLAAAYAVDLATYVVVFVLVTMMSKRPPVRDPDAPVTSGVRSLKEGFAYLKGRKVLQSTFTIDLVAMIFGMPRALFPLLAVTQFGATTEAEQAYIFTWLLAAIAVGALLGALTAGWVGAVRRQGLAVLIAVLIWGAGIALFGLVGDRLPLAVLLLAIAGGADVISAVFRSSILQQSVPDNFRGRMSAIHILVVTGGPRLGDLEAGLVARAFSPTVSVVSGGVFTMLGVGLIHLLVPRFATYQAGDET